MTKSTKVANPQVLVIQLMAVKVHTHDSCTHDFMVIIPNTESAVKLRNDISFFFFSFYRKLLTSKFSSLKELKMVSTRTLLLTQFAC